MIAVAVLCAGAFAIAPTTFNARFTHDDTTKQVTIGVTGQASINITRTRPEQPAESTLLHATSMEGGQLKLQQAGRPQMETSSNGESHFEIQFSNETIRSNVTITKNATSLSWKFSFGKDLDGGNVELTIDVALYDCSAAPETTTDASTTASTGPTTTAADASTSAATTATPKTTTATPTTTADASTSTTTTVVPETTTASPATTTDASTSTTTTESHERRLEANESTSAPETTQAPDEEEEEEEEEEAEGTSDCDSGFSCHATLKSCQVVKHTLPAGSSGNTGNNSNAVQNSSYAILAAVVTYLMI